MKTRDVILVMLFAGLIGCKPMQTIPIHDSTVTDNSVTVTQDPTWTVPAEAYWNMVFECDSNYEVLLRDYEALNSGIKETIKIKEIIEYREDKTAIKRLSVNISALVDSIEVQNKTIESFI